ncbi:MAG: phosphohistidine phosphatase SixA [Candidatus Binataceae bacterium]|nr:phosphohistidine phosphatase SixA [Candidatus Binataceae bacterium]
MKLYLVRHAIAEDPAPGINDHDRALTDTGKSRMMRTTEGLRKLKIRPALILTSPLKRAHQTAEIVSGGLAGVKIELMPELAPGAAPSKAIDALRAYAKHKSVALVGHQPSLGYMLSLLLTGSERHCEFDFKKGAVACLKIDLSPNPTRSVLQWFATPKILRHL